jgi:hypothetical protein
VTYYGVCHRRGVPALQILASTPHPEAMFMQQTVRSTSSTTTANGIIRDSTILVTGAPVSQMTNRVRRRPRLGGLLNFYERAA